MGFPLWFSGFRYNINTKDEGKMLLIVYSVAEAETTEGLFDDIVGLWASVSADAADFTVRDVLLELCFAEDHSALDFLRCRTRQ